MPHLANLHGLEPWHSAALEFPHLFSLWTSPIRHGVVAIGLNSANAHQSVAMGWNSAILGQVPANLLLAIGLLDLSSLHLAIGLLDLSSLLLAIGLADLCTILNRFGSIEEALLLS